MKPVQQWKIEEIIEFVKSVDKKVWGTAIAVFLGIVLLWTVLIKPAWFDRPVLRRKMQSMDSQMQHFRELSKKRSLWEENEKTFSRLIADTKARVHKEGEVALLLGQVSRVAEDAGVDVVASRPRKGSPDFPDPFGDNYQAVGYDFTVQGGYHSLGVFAAGIESYPKLLRIQTIHILPAESDPGKLKAEYGLAAIAEQTAPPVKPAKKKTGKTATNGKKK